MPRPNSDAARFAAFEKDTELAEDDELAEALAYWQLRADVGSAPGFGQRYADLCRAEITRRNDQRADTKGTTP